MKGWNVKTLISSLKKYQYALLVLVLGLILLMVPTGQKREDSPEPKASSSDYADEDSTAALERRLGEVLSQMKGVGEAEVLLTLSAGSERILAQDMETDGERSKQTTVVLKNSSSQETTVTTQVIYPTFQGALVVCDGGENASVRLSVVRAVQALTGLRTGNISVCARTGGMES